MLLRLLLVKESVQENSLMKLPARAQFFQLHQEWLEI